MGCMGAGGREVEQLARSASGGPRLLEGGLCRGGSWREAEGASVQKGSSPSNSRFPAALRSGREPRTRLKRNSVCLIAIQFDYPRLTFSSRA